MRSYLYVRNCGIFKPLNKVERFLYIEMSSYLYITLFTKYRCKVGPQFVRFSKSVERHTDTHLGFLLNLPYGQIEPPV